VIGGGPAGLAASIYLARFKRRVAIFEHGIPRVYWAPKIRNLLGYRNGIRGADLLAEFRRHSHRYRKIKRFAELARIRRISGGFRVITESGEVHTSRKVILATGVNDVQPTLGNLDALRKRGVLRYCSICDGYEMAKSRIAVLAKDDEGIQKALFLANWTKEIHLILPPSLKITKHRARQMEGIGFRITRSDHFEIGKGRRDRMATIRTAEGTSEKYAAIYVELGCDTHGFATKGLKGLDTAAGGFINATAEQRTSVPGLFAAGDCVNRLGQVSVALGQAAIAATNVHHELCISES
jgi:thioredoxin reductase (NADPH)